MGRSTPSGPVTGGYDVFSAPMDATVGNATFTYYFVAPAACTAVEASCMADDITVAGSLNWVIQNGGAAGAGTTNIVASRTHPADDTVETIAGASLTNRTIAKGDIIKFQWIGTNAGDIVRRGLITLTVRYTGHVVADERND